MILTICFVCEKEKECEEFIDTNNYIWYCCDDCFREYAKWKRIKD